MSRLLNEQDRRELEEEIGNAGGNANCPLTVVTITIDDSGETENVPVTGIILDYSTISLTEGESMMLAASVSPSNATNNTVLWKSSNTGIATVDNGYVTAVAEGDAMITAYSAENNAIEATCSVAVSAAESGGEEGGESGGTVTVKYSTLEWHSTSVKKDGTIVELSDKAFHVEFPFIEGMFVSTECNSGWLVNYPPFVVYDGGSYHVPEYNKNTPVFTATLSGYSNSAVVYANIYVTAGTIENFMANNENSYYSYES